MYCYVWSFIVRPEHLTEFQTAYGPDGDWAWLFRRDPQYIRTDLLRDRDDPTRFLTVDFWTSREACASFRTRFKGDFETLDKSCERFTIEETQIGSFDVLSEKV